MTLYARRSNRQPWRLVCGVRDCGATIGYVLETHYGKAVVLEPEWRPRYSRGRDSYVWERREKTRPVVLPTGRTTSKPRLPRPMQGHHNAAGQDTAWIAFVLPAEVICPDSLCGFRQSLDAARLGVDFAETPQRVYDKPSPCPTPHCPEMLAFGQTCKRCAASNRARPIPGQALLLPDFRRYLMDAERHAITESIK